MYKQVFEVDSDGTFIESYLWSEEEIQSAKDEGRHIIEKIWKPFYKPKYDFELDDWVEGQNVSIILKGVKKSKIVELNQSCNKTILGKFSHDVNGVTYYFSNDMEAQANFEKCDRAFEKGRMTELAWTCYDVDGNVVRLVLTPETFESLYVAHLEHIQNNIAKFRDFLMPQVEGATTVEEIESIQW
jgi:YHS domain-containing protein